MNIWIKVGKKRPIYMLVSRCDQYLFDGYTLASIPKKNGSVRVRCIKTIKGDEIRIYAHRLIMNPSEGEFVDHVNRNQLDNTRENLRIVNNRQNSLNKTKSSIHNVYKRSNGLYFYVIYEANNVHVRENFETIKSCFCAMLKKKKQILKEDFIYYNHYDPDLIVGNEKIETVKNNKYKGYSSTYLQATSVGSSNLKGVRVRHGKFLAEINHNSKCIHLGSFSSEKEAARAYDKAAVELKGFGCELNFPDEHNPRSSDQNSSLS
jgi:hypothetical protein